MDCRVKPGNDDPRCIASFITHQVPSGFSSSSGKYLNTLMSGLGAAWPSPQIEASRIASDSSVNKASSQGPVAISFTAFSVPIRHGVHWPQLSSSKKRMRLSATALRQFLFVPALQHFEPIFRLSDKLPQADFNSGVLGEAPNRGQPNEPAA